MASQGTHILRKGARCGDLDLSDMTGDVTVSADGVSTIGSAKVTTVMQTANARTRVARTQEIDIDNGAGTTQDLVLTRLSKAITITAARVVYTDATSGTVAAATVQLGVAVAGATIVAAVALEDAKAVGTITALTVAVAAVAANTPLIVRHTGIAATAAGKYYVEVEYTVND